MRAIEKTMTERAQKTEMEMTNTKTLLQRIATAISTAPQGETYEDCRNNEAKAVLEEIADWIENDSNWYYLTLSQLRQESNR